MSLLKSKKNTAPTVATTPASVAEIIEKAIKEVEQYQKTISVNDTERATKAIFSEDYSERVAKLNNEFDQIDKAIKGLNATMRAVKLAEKNLEYDPNIKTR